MLPILTANEARVIGCLMEKSVITPDQYPLTLNALTNACNQKSSRDPVLSLEQGTVQRSVKDLQAKHLVRIEENFKSGVEKYRQRLCNTAFSEYQLDAGQFAIICLLFLRGAQTPGELRAHSGRLHTFADNDAVVAALDGLLSRDGDPLVVRLPRTPGRKDSEYMHLFYGAVDTAAVESEPRVVAAPPPPAEPDVVTALAERVRTLEIEVEKLKAHLRLATPAV